MRSFHRGSGGSSGTPLRPDRCCTTGLVAIGPGVSEPPTGWLKVGKVTGAHGIRGWVKVYAFTDPVENFLSLGQWCLEGGERLTFDGGKRQGKGLVAHITGVDDRSSAERFRGAEILAPAAALPGLDAGEYYWRELVGLEVWCRDRDVAAPEGAEQSGTAPQQAVLLGIVSHLIETGANDVLVIKPCAGSVDERERLVPYLPDDVVSAVDPAAGRIEVDWYVDE